MTKGKIISKREEVIFRNEYNKWLKELCETLVDYRENMIKVMRDTNLKTFNTDQAFKDTGKKAVFHKLLCFYQQEAAIEETNSLLNEID